MNTGLILNNKGVKKLPNKQPKINRLRGDVPKILLLKSMHTRLGKLDSVAI